MIIKKLLLPLVFFTTIIFSTEVNGQFHSPNLIKFNIGSLVFSEFNLGYERAIGNHFSGGLSILYLSKSLDVNTVSDMGVAYTGTLSLNGGGFIPEFRFYPTNKGAPKGVYISLFIVARNIELEMIGQETVSQVTFKGTVSTTINGGGMMLGKQWVLGGNTPLDIAIGINNVEVGVGDLEVVRSDGINQTLSLGTNSLSGTLPRLTIAIGIAF